MIDKQQHCTVALMQILRSALAWQCGTGKILEEQEYQREKTPANLFCIETADCRLLCKFSWHISGA